MEIIVTLTPDGMVSLKCSEDRPWAVLDALRVAADGVVKQQAKLEGESATGIQLASSLPNGRNGR